VIGDDIFVDVSRIECRVNDRLSSWNPYSVIGR